MTTPEAKGPLVLLTTNDPNQCAEALVLLLAASPGAHIAVVAYGGHGEDCLAIAGQMRPPEGVTGTGVHHPTEDRHQAINYALEQVYEDHPVVAIVDQDIRVCDGWLGELIKCLKPDAVHGLGERQMQGYDSIGLVAACTDQAHSAAQRVNLSEQEAGMGLAAYAAARLQHFTGKVSAANLVDGCCVVMPAPAVVCGMVNGQLVDPDLGTWAWADLCLRLADNGHRVAVSEGAYVGRTTAVGLGNAKVGNVQDRLRFYAKHEDTAEQRIITLTLAPLVTWQQMQLLRASLRRMAPLVDGMVIVVGGNPLEIQEDPEYQTALRAKMVNAMDTRMMKGCSGKAAPQVGEAVEAWVQAVLDVPGRRVGRMSVKVHAWEGPKDGRQQRNHGLRMAEELGATAVWSVDYDEVPDARMTRDKLERILSHPNPLVRGWDCGIAYHWDTPTLVREDAPWGHGGRYVGGPHAVRLHRLRHRRAGLILFGPGAGALPDVDPDSQRVAHLTMRRFRGARSVDRQRLGVIGSDEGMRLSAYTGDNRMGLHCLVYEGEDPEDLARWLDQAHGLVDHVVLVWTGEWDDYDRAWEADGMCDPSALAAPTWPTTGPSREMAVVAHLHGCQWVHHPLRDNFADARNTGIDALALKGGMRWAWFIDPDEWFANPLADAAALRNMTSSDRWGWLVQVVNYRADKEVPTISDSVRISRMDPDRIMRMDGRVHEGFSEAIHLLQQRGVHPRLVYAPFMLQQRGMALEPGRMDAKLRKYEHMLRLELQDRPHSPGAWVSLGWHYFNDGHHDEGLECYRRALACAGNSYLPFKEMAYHHLREARRLMDECDKRLAEGHQFHDLAQQMRQWLGKYAPPHPIIPRLEDTQPAPLPDWEPPALPGLSGYDAP